jgi:hypothetical protein
MQWESGCSGFVGIDRIVVRERGGEWKCITLRYIEIHHMSSSMCGMWWRTWQIDP